MTRREGRPVVEQTPDAVCAQPPTDLGASLFARYAYAPNELGYCGPDGAADLLDHAAHGTNEIELASRAPQFDGAWVYLEAIAAAARLSPLDAQVVEAYWVGNDLLSLVDAAELLAALQARFRQQSGGLLPHLVASPDVLAHHGFHVFAVYPWVGLLDNGGGVPRSVLDSCRIRWGTVVSIVGDRLDVECRALTWQNSRLGLGSPQLQSVRWSAAGKSLLLAPAVGDVVSMHWDWVCDRLAPAQVDTLAAATEHALSLANAQR